ncbi:MAG: hypothetical protein EOM76_13145 [Sphingobacteriia bacterium]|nr:hypothetical protein [Sphingobacteriia bacterium]
MSANNFILDTRDHKFVLKEWLDVDKVLSFDAYKDYYTKEDADTFIELVYKICAFLPLLGILTIFLPNNHQKS